MMMGPTKKKVIATGIIAFIIPVVVGSVLFVNYKKETDAEIERLSKQGEVTHRYVFAESMLAGDIITAEDIKMVNVKGESAPVDSYSGDKSDLIGRKLRINAEEKTIITTSMLTNEVDKNPTIDERYQEYNMIVLPSDLVEGDFVDVRITMPSGEDYLIVSGKEVKQIGTTADSNSVFLQLDEEEIIRMTAAIIESYLYDGYKIYANKYVDPSNQLYDYERVNYVVAYQQALQTLIAERQELAETNINEYINTYEPDMSIEEIDKILRGEVTVEITAANITDEEVAAVIGLTVKQTRDIKNALATSDADVLDVYDDKLVVTRLDMINTYPVKTNIANLIKKDPNILETVKEKYDIDALIEERANLLEIPLYKINDEGEMEFLEAMDKLQENLTKEIEAQRTERKEYLQALILEESSSK